LKRFTDYEGGYLNHLEGFYRSEDRELALELAQALELAVSEIRFTANSRPVVAVHPNADDRDPTNNVIFLYEMPEVQRRVIDLLQRRMETDPEVREAVAAYRETAAKMPPLMPHFGLRYGSHDQLQAVTETLERGLSPALKARVAVWEVPPYEPIDGLPDIRQVFVRTDVLSIGAAGFEQAIELQVVR
jgi:hypothetical protein